MSKQIYQYTRDEWLAAGGRHERSLRAAQHANAVATAAGSGIPVPRRVLSYYRNRLHNHPLFRAEMEKRGIDPDPIEVGCVKTVPRKSINFYEAALAILQGEIQLHSLKETTDE